MAHYFKILFGFVFAFALSLPANAENYFEKPLHHAVTYTENALWIAEEFGTAADGWQDRISRKAFATETQATSFLLKQGYNKRTHPPKPNRFSEPAALNSSGLWPVQNSWTWEWEQRFSDWIRSEVDPEFFIRYHVATDCADVAYILRWIFARNNGLPAFAHLAATGKIMTHETMRAEWQNLPTDPIWHKDRRFLKAIDYLLDNVYTHTLGVDSYPIEISPRAMIAGTHFLSIMGPTGHTHLIHRTYYDDAIALPIKLIASTVPQDVRSLFETDFWEGSQPRKESGGFLRFLWPVKVSGRWTLLAPEQMPYYSLEQFDSNFLGDETSFAFAVYKKLNPNFSIESWTRAGVRDLKEQINMREQIVADGSAICARQSCEPGTDNFENWSTPSRDKRLRSIFKQVELTAERFTRSKPIWKAALNEDVIAFESTRFNLNSVFFVWNFEMFESDPRVSVARRWGLTPQGFAENLQSKIQTNLNLRAKKIASANCSNCRVGDDRWLEQQTFFEDRSLILLRSPDEKYCSQMPQALCATYNAQRSNLIASAAGQSMSVPGWLENSPWLNSDPTQTSLVRWGANKSKLRYQRIDRDRAFVVAKNGLVFRIPEVGTASITKLGTNEIKTAPQGHVWVALSANGLWAASRPATGEVVTLHELATGKTFNYKADGDTTQAFYGENVFVIRRALSRNTEFVRLESTPKSITTLEGTKNVSSSEIPGVLLELSIGVVQIFDTRPQAKSFHYLLTGIPTTNFARLRFETPTDFIIETPVSVRVGKVSADTEVLLHLRGLDGFAFDSKLAIRHNPTQGDSNTAFLVGLTDSLASTGEQNYGVGVMVKTPLACFDRSSSSHVCYAYNGKTLNLNPLFTDRKLTDWNSTHFAYRQGNYTTAQLSMFGAQSSVLYQAPELRAIDSLGSYFEASAGDQNQFKLLIDANRADLGSLVTGFDSEVTRSLQSPLNSIHRGVVIELPTDERIWVERVSE